MPLSAIQVAGDALPDEAYRVVGLIALQGFVLAPALALTAWIRIAARGRIGEARALERPRRRLRLGLLVAPQLALLALVVILGLAPAVQAALLVAQGIALAWIVPSPDDAVLAAEGVRRGFLARRFAELEEWRLAGRHLRFRLRGEWTSVPVPEDCADALRARLVATIPERESPFG